jgi:hypothetical protein
MRRSFGHATALTERVASSTRECPGCVGSAGMWVQGPNECSSP